ncbi:helix-turn-helix domain-containing protein [Amycolatopsis sp. NPDC051373]|uniref:helix-turn-helix domain-containing protein n=1 Tax=Amycolatopsis sp. NPDC051373 TaxID=3155801 RepID=UPI00344C4011
MREVSGASGRTVVHALNAAREAGARVAAACTAAFFLAEAGVLDGVRATTSWWLGLALRRRYPRVDVDETRTLCVGEDVITAGAALAHLDLALSLVAASSPALADLVSRYLLIGNRTTQQDFAATEILVRGNPLVAAFERRVRSRLGESLQVAALAGELGVTERSLQRTLQAELGMSPRELITEIRLQRAIHLPRTTGLTVDAVATRVGYLNGGTLRTLIRRRRGLGVGEVRGSGSPWLSAPLPAPSPD